MSVSRRELLNAFLGLPAALAACRHASNRSPAMPAGEIAFRREVIGHRLRDQPPIEPLAGRWENATVVIVGAGIAGLAAAWRLFRAGLEDFVILELDATPGGTSRSASASAGGGYPWGAHYITVPMKESRAVLALLSEMSVLEGFDSDGEPIVAEQHLCRDPQERVFYRGYWYEDLYLYAGASAEDTRQRKAFDAEVGRLAEWRDSRGRRAFAMPSSRSSDDAEILALDRMTMAQWMDGKGFTSPRLRWYVEYGCRDDYGLRMTDTSAWAGLFYHVARVTKAGSDYQPVITWPEGNGRLVAHLSRVAGKRLRLGRAVVDIRHRKGDSPDNQPIASGYSGRPIDPGGTIEVIALTHGGRDAAGIRAKNVIFAAPHFLTPHLIRDYRSARPAHVDEFDYGSWMVANLTLRDRPLGRGFPLAWDNVLYDSPSLGYVVSTHQRGLDHGPTIITYYYPLLASDSRAARSRLLQAGWAEWAEVALSDLERAHPDIRALTERIDIARWGHAMIRPRPGFITGQARKAALLPHRGIHFAHSDLSGISLFEEAFDHGVRAAEEVLVARSIAHESMR
ncbi:MAG: FAD-dependent oxidoreductase [Proteobacteria bacterium]|nr:FAD-dependent oxidoreductase [Pseudomonadota bacterium]